MPSPSRSKSQSRSGSKSKTKTKTKKVSPFWKGWNAAIRKEEAALKKGSKKSTKKLSPYWKGWDEAIRKEEAALANMSTESMKKESPYWQGWDKAIRKVEAQLPENKTIRKKEKALTKAKMAAENDELAKAAELAFAKQVVQNAEDEKQLSGWERMNKPIDAFELFSAFERDANKNKEKIDYDALEKKMRYFEKLGMTEMVAYYMAMGKEHVKKQLEWLKEFTADDFEDDVTLQIKKREIITAWNNLLHLKEIEAAYQAKQDAKKTLKAKPKSHGSA